MSNPERAPLLPDSSNTNTNGSTGRSSGVWARIKGDGEPSWGASLRFFLFGSWLNVLLLFLPLSAISHFLEWDAGLRFGFSFMAIVPLAKLLGEATEQLSVKLGPTLGGLLNASFGNAVEVIVGVAALLQGQLRIVQTSMLGSILSNLLLVLGMSFFAGGLKKVFDAKKPATSANGSVEGGESRAQNEFSSGGAQNSASLMTLSCITLVIPAAYRATQSSHTSPINLLNKLNTTLDDHLPDDDTTKPGLLIISRGTSILLLLVYAAYLVFQLRTHKSLFDGKKARVAGEEEEEEEEVARMSMVSAGACLLAITLITSFCADWLVASIEETADKYDIPKPFIGLILLPLVANAAEHVTSVWMAMKDKMELTIGISIGSSIQISTFVVPLLVIVGWITGHDLTLYFANFETIVLFVSVLLVNSLVQDGKSNYLEGLILVVLYIVIALAFWVTK